MDSADGLKCRVRLFHGWLHWKSSFWRKAPDIISTDPDSSFEENPSGPFCMMYELPVAPIIELHTGSCSFSCTAVMTQRLIFIYINI